MNFQYTIFQVFELCEGGSILDRLRDSDKPVPLVSTLLDYCTQIVKALTYLGNQSFFVLKSNQKRVLQSQRDVCIGMLLLEIFF